MTKSAVARGASMAASIWGKLDDAVKTKGGTEDALHILAKDDGGPLIDVIADILVKAEFKIRTRFTVRVDYTKSLADMVNAGGYSCVDVGVTPANFPLEGDGVVKTEIVLVHFDRDIEFDDAIKELEQRGLVPCKIEHLLDLGAKYPDLQREYPIVCLGSSWVNSHGGRLVPSLNSFHGCRRIDLYWFGDGWDDDWRFLAVRKS